MSLFGAIKQQAATYVAPSTTAALYGPLHDLSTLSEVDPFDIDGLGVPLMPHQWVPVKAFQTVDSMLLADEMGVGKTPTAIAIILSRKAFPACFVVPPSLVENWKKEIARFAPGKSVAAVSGTKAGVVPSTDFVLVPDSVVFQWAMVPDPNRANRTLAEGPLSKHGFAAIVVDECHRLKNVDAKRSRGVYGISRMLAPTAVRLLMSGTPLVNRPDELVAPLTILNVINRPEFGGRAKFLSRHVQYEFNGFGSKAVGGANLEELNRKLLNHVMVRRKREQVLTLPNKGRSMVRVTMTREAQRRYTQAEDNLIQFLRAESGNYEKTLDWRAEAIVLLNSLRRIAGEGKIEATVDYVRALLDEGEQVFVACWHQSVATALWKEFHKDGCVSIVGGMSSVDKQASVDAFQSGKARVLVGNIQAAGVGFTLTAGRHIVVAELPWTSADLQQVEDRLHRIGQSREVISSVVLADWATGSIDEKLWGLIDAKASTLGAVLDGDASGLKVDEGSVASQLLDSYR